MKTIMDVPEKQDVSEKPNQQHTDGLREKERTDFLSTNKIGSAFKRLIVFFAKDPELPLIQDQQQIDRIYKKQRMLIIVTATLAYTF